GETAFGVRRPGDGRGVGPVFVVHAGNCKASTPRADRCRRRRRPRGAPSVAYTKKWGSTDRPAAPGGDEQRSHGPASVRAKEVQRNVAPRPCSRPRSLTRAGDARRMVAALRYALALGPQTRALRRRTKPRPARPIPSSPSEAGSGTDVPGVMGIGLDTRS